MFSSLLPASGAELGTITVVSGSYGGGWELTARSTGDALVDLELADGYTIDTLEGAAGWRALSMFLTKDKYKDGLLVQSEPLISGFLKKKYKKGFRDLKPVATLIAEYSCVVVADDSPFKTFDDILIAIESNPREVLIALGGRKGTGDHLVANMIFKAAGIKNYHQLRYTFADGGDHAAIKMLKDRAGSVAVSGYNSIITQSVADGAIRVIGVTSSESIDNHLTLKEQGIDLEYANWRGFFARKDISEKKFNNYAHALKILSDSTLWAKVIEINGWSPFYKSGPELQNYLLQQEKTIKDVMTDLNLL